MVTRKRSTFSRRQFLKQSGLGAATVAGALAGLGCASSDTAPTIPGRARGPNIIFLLTDDQRWDALGCMGNPIIQTPNIDRLAKEGVTFPNHFVTTSICPVSRASIFTGLYARCHGIHEFHKSLSEKQQTMSYPVMLHGAGYRTGFIGKYGVGLVMPRERYDYFTGFSRPGEYLHQIDGKTVHLTKIMGDQALEFLEGCSDDQPFCLSISFKAPHVQHDVPPYFINDPAYEHLYQDITIPDFKKNHPRYYEALPDFLKANYEGRVRWKQRFSTPEKYQESVKRYYRLITGVDVQVGRILQTLEQCGWYNNTVIIFTSDHGFYLGERGLAGKWLMHEESIRTPLILRDPRARETQGTRRTEMTLNIDFAPTILRLAGIDPPPSMNGRNLRPLVAGESPPWRTDWFYEHLFEHPTIPKTEGVRTEHWKHTRYIEINPLYEELYDLKNDPEEEHNLAKSAAYREPLEQMRERWRIWKENLESWRPDQLWHEPA